MNFDRIIPIWQKFAVGCAVFTMLTAISLGFIDYIGGNQCPQELFSAPNTDNDKIAGAVVASGFMLIFLDNIRKSASVNELGKFVNAAKKYDIRVISEFIPITYLHIAFYVPLFGFFLFTFVGPILSAALLYSKAVHCGYL